MVNKLIDATPGNEIPKLLEEANNLFKSQKYSEAQSIYENLIAMDPGNPKIIAGMLRCLLQLQKINDVKEVLESLDEKILKDDEIAKIKILYNNFQNSSDGISLDDILNNLKNDPPNKELRFSLAEKYLSLNEIEKGFNELLQIYSDDPQWNDEAAKKKLLEHFDLLGFNDPNVMEARKKLSSLMFK